jgi:[CysO sulfur-carrier protein]-S-L-cysteine hydrolase
VSPALPPDLTPVLRHLEATWPEEGCGVILRRGEAWRVRPIANAYARPGAPGSGPAPRSARTAYRFEPTEWLRACLEADAAGETVACIFHSHVDAGAHFSAVDRAHAAPGGRPLLPGVSYLVVGVYARRATAAKLYWWNGGGFAERPVPLGS